MSPGLEGASIPTRTLSGADEEAHLATLIAAVRAARLNAQFPDSRQLAAHLGALGPRVHRGLYDGLEVDLRSGLPSYKEWTRAQTDVRIAADQLRQLGPRAQLEERARRSPGSAVHQRQLLKHLYYSDLVGVELAPLGDMTVTLRKLDPAARRAHVHVVLDKLDVSGTFVRYSIDLAQTDDGRAAPIVTLDGDAASATESFRSLVYAFTSYDAEFTFVKLAALGNLAVERVVKGVVGPVCVAWTRAPDALRPLLGPGRLVAMFSLDMAATDLAADRDNDPFEDLLKEGLSAEARAGYEEARRRYGYKVFKDRKFVASRDLVEPLRVLCAAARATSIVYPL
jgi:hypothetical protein